MSRGTAMGWAVWLVREPPVCLSPYRDGAPGSLCLPKLTSRWGNGHLREAVWLVQGHPLRLWQACPASYLLCPHAQRACCTNEGAEVPSPASTPPLARAPSSLTWLGAALQAKLHLVARLHLCHNALNG